MEENKMRIGVPSIAEQKLNMEICKLHEELLELKCWKAKARPFLVNEFRNVNNSFLYAQSRGESFRDLTEIHETLTELLGGSDEN